MRIPKEKEDKQKARYKRLTEDKIYPLLWCMAIPSMIGMMVSSVYSMTDTFFIGMLNKTELTAAVGIVFSFTSIIQAIGFWFGYGSGNYAARQIGKGEITEAKRVITAAMTLALIVGIIISTNGIIFLRPLARALGAGVSHELMKATVSYLFITLISVPIMLVTNVLYNVLRLQGSAKDSMLGMLAGMLLNILLDPVFILGLNMGVAGAALASLLGQISGLVLLVMLARKDGNVFGNIGNIPLCGIYLKKILIGGTPNFCRQGISSIATVFLNQASGFYGEAGVAGVTVALRVLSMAYALVIGFGQGFQPLCLVNYSAGKLERVKKGFRAALITMTCFLLVATFVLYRQTDSISALLTQDTEAIRVASDILKMQCLILPFMGYYILMGMLLQNIGRFGLATLVTVAEDGFFLIPVIHILPILYGYSGFVCCKCVASIGALLLSLALGIGAWMKYLKKS